ncbi:serine hydrolase domain-containing protein [Spongiimicrobium salis]|uniref:serine hydrolase domain-containing protein n=1 Tax=Spongiimicrobium salis TaxID=1667022 RepID=UPI00374D223C
MKYIKALCFSIFILESCFGQTLVKIESPASVGISAKCLQLVQDSLRTYVDNGNLAGIQTALIKDQKLIYFDNYGYASLAHQRKVDEHSLFRIFSMTKPIVSVALMQLYEAGKFDLNDPLSKFLPEFKQMQVYNAQGKLVPSKRPIRIIDLLRHSSGVGYGNSQNQALNRLYQKANPRSASSLKEMINILSTLPLAFEPGTNWEYGYSTDICGYLIEVLSGMRLDEYLQKNIFGPLAMNSTFFRVPKARLDDFTVGYGYENGQLVVVDDPLKSRFTREITILSGGGGLVSTTLDYINFCKMLLNKGSFNGKQLIAPETLSLMTKDHTRPILEYRKQLGFIPGETGFGLGFSIRSRKKDDDRGIYGWGGAVGTYFRIDPEKGAAYIMMIQRAPYRDLGLRNVFQNLIQNALDSCHKMVH